MSTVEIEHKYHNRQSTAKTNDSSKLGHQIEDSQDTIQRAASKTD